MILIGLGGNLESPSGPPRATCAAALERLERNNVSVIRCSPWYETAPVPASDQPMFVNGVAEVETEHNPQELLRVLHAIEQEFARRRMARNEARTLDLDLLCYHDQVRDVEGAPPILPHPRLHERAFVLLPLCDLAPSWIHPTLKVTAAELVLSLPPGQMAARTHED
jgi:2-amino-4-hydroxy-6-hydroxymethyldihydropteridine diphosphokinase